MSYNDVNHWKCSLPCTLCCTWRLVCLICSVLTPMSLSMPQYDQLSGGHLMGHVGSKMNYQAWMSPSSPAGCWSHLCHQVLEEEERTPRLSTRWWDLYLVSVLHYPFHTPEFKRSTVTGELLIEELISFFFLWS